MALDPNIGRIKFLRSKTTRRKPTTTDIDEGELALNLVDRTIYTRNGNNIVDIGFGLGGQVNGNITTSGTVKATKLEGPLTGNAATATKLAVARLINNTPFDGTSNITLSEAVFSGYLANYVLSDYNNVPEAGFSVRYIPSAGLNKAPGTDHALVSLSHSANWIVQQAYDWRTNRQYNRSKKSGTWGDWRTVAYLDDDITGNAVSATKLQTERTLSWTGDATGSLSFNGSANVSAALTLANSGVTAGTYKSVTVDTKGRVTAGNEVVTGLITSTTATSTANVATTNTNTYLNIIETVGTAISTVGSSSQITGAGTVTVASDAAGKITITGSQTITGNAASATKLQTARTIFLTGDASGSVTFDGTSNATINTTVTLLSSLPIYTKDATHLPTDWNKGISSTFVNAGVGFPSYGGVITARPYTNGGGTLQIYTPYGTQHGGDTIAIRFGDYSSTDSNQWTGFKYVLHDKNFNKYAPTLTGGGASGSWAINAATATSLQTARTIGITGSGASGSISFDGTGNVNIPLVIATQPTTTNNTTIATTAFVQAVNLADTGSAATALALKTARTIGGVSFDGSANINLPGVNTAGNQSTTGNAATATALQTARTINGVSFNGTANIQIDAIRVGTITWHLGNRSSVFTGDLVCDGQVLNRADYPELWNMVNAGRFASVTDAVWLSDVSKRGAYSTGNGSTTFRLPDLNGGQAGSIPDLFLRGTKATNAGTVLDDAIRNITGAFGTIADQYSSNSASGSFEKIEGAYSQWLGHSNGANGNLGSFSFNASRVVPTADENRPKSVFGIWVVSAKGSNVAVPGGSTAATLTGGNTFQGSQTINGDLIVNQNETVKGNLTVEGLTADRFGLHDKMHWVGACIQPYGTSVLNTSVTTNTFQVIIKGESGAKYWTKGRTKLHFIINHGTPQNARFVTATVTDWSTTDSNKQTITATLSLVNHDMPLNTVFHWVGSTYESFGCDWAGWMNIVGGSRQVMRLKPTTPLKSLTPIITSSCSSDSYWNASQLSQPGVEPQQRSEMGSIVINSVHEGDVVFAIGDNNNDRSVSNEYVSISVKDFV